MGGIRLMPQEYKPDLAKANFSFRGLLLYILPAPLFLKVLISLIKLKLFPLALSSLALFFFYSSAHMTRQSLIRVAENRLRPKPKKINDKRPLAMIYVGVGVFALVFMIKHGINLRTIAMPLFAMLGYYLAYGISEPAHEAPVDFEQMPKATREAIQGAYDDLEKIESLATQLDDHDKKIAASVDKVVAQSYKILELLSNSPNDAGRARRFLNVYINRIKEILAQYISLAKYDKAADYRERLIDVLKETNKAFSAQESKLLDDDQFKLDVQLEVLDEQIKNEQK